ncbi:MAG: hypothetical protein NC548_51935 [Lachnospiraceae bacterium]|nr:hypothetical protein [Lachnospiraceae bacterium]
MYAPYTGDAMIFVIAGDVKAIKGQDSIGRYYEIPVQIKATTGVPTEGRSYTKNQIAQTAEELIAENAPRRIIDWLVCYDGKNVSDKRLQETAARNREFNGKKPLAESALKAHFADQLSNNFIYLQERIPNRIEGQNEADTTRHYYTAYMIFRVSTNPRTILNAVEVGDAAEYLNSACNLEYVASGYFGLHTDVIGLLTKKVKGMQSAYSVSSDDVSKISFIGGEPLNNGVVRLYRPMWEADGTRYSKPIGYARLYNVHEGEGNLMPLTTGAKKAMPEDVAVHTSDKRNALKIEATL